MLNWLFKKRDDGPALRPPPPPVVVSRVSEAEQKRELAEASKAQWQARLRESEGDDEALLRLALEAPLLPIKLAAIEALETVEVLKRAERELRTQDRKAHSTAKKRLERKATEREAQTRAKELITCASALLLERPIPANRLVTLDRDWQALDAELLPAGDCAQFAALRDQLTAALRESGEREQTLQRWNAQAEQALVALHAACVDAASDLPHELPEHRRAAQALRDGRSGENATATLDHALHAALQTASSLRARLAWLGELAAAPAETGGEEPANRAPAAPGLSVDDASRVWNAFPSLTDPAVAHPLNQRFERWLRGHSSIQPMKPVVAPGRPSATEPSTEQLQAVESALERAEVALAAGQVGAMQGHLGAVQDALEAMGRAKLPSEMHARHQALLAERARLRDWQTWGGALALEALLAEAEDLARITLEAAEPEGPPLAVKAHGDAIHALRQRWKQLDRQGAAQNQSLWQRFDEALQTAYKPVAAHHATLKVARESNMLNRLDLLNSLDALPGPSATASIDEKAAHWKAQAYALDQFRAAWRRLGPIQHTVPAQERDALLERLQQSTARVEAPLEQARRAAESVRESLIQRAEALAQEAASQPQLRDAAARVRDLQSEWQQQARTVPLARAVESALWTRFKAATDAVFAQRQALAQAAQAECAALVAQREALLQRIVDLPLDAAHEDLRKALAEVDRAWRGSDALPRSEAAALEARYRDARDAVQRHINGRMQARWRADCDTLLAKLALCEDQERDASANAELVERWAMLAALPAGWDQALAQRWSAPTPSGPLTEAEFDSLLLQLEIVLDLPSPPESQTARRALKLQAMKDLLEGRAGVDMAPAQVGAWLCATFRQSGITSAQQARLRGLLASLHERSPDALGVKAR